MATKKITVTLPQEVLDAARALTDNLSGYAAAALTARVQHDLLGQELARHAREHGPIDGASIEQAESELFGTAAPRGELSEIGSVAA
jgi:post-segregation antitoxin (ccd killing protein)